MNLLTLSYVIFFTLVGSIFSLIGGVLLLTKKGLTEKVSHLLISFAAGTLIGTAFFDLLPEAMDGYSIQNVLALTLIGFLFFFVLERFIHWSHHHPHGEEKPTVSLIVFGDSIHNFIDGVVIAASFLVSIPLGIVTAIAVAMHEIPQEIGDFAIMLNRGVKPRRVVLLNLLSACTALLGALLMVVLGDKIKNQLPIFISLTAGFFLYISASDLIPEIHEKNKRGFALFETLLLVLGVVVVWLLVNLLDH